MRNTNTCITGTSQENEEYIYSGCWRRRRLMKSSCLTHNSVWFPTLILHARRITLSEHTLTDTSSRSIDSLCRNQNLTRGFVAGTVRLNHVIYEYKDQGDLNVNKTPSTNLTSCAKFSCLSLGSDEQEMETWLQEVLTLALDELDSTGAKWRKGTVDPRSSCWCVGEEMVLTLARIAFG
jgi:hypothetical protein